jgi:hypothetical protein
MKPAEGHPVVDLIGVENVEKILALGFTIIGSDVCRGAAWWLRHDSEDPKVTGETSAIRRLYASSLLGELPVAPMPVALADDSVAEGKGPLGTGLET